MLLGNWCSENSTVNTDDDDDGDDKSLKMFKE